MAESRHEEALVRRLRRLSPAGVEPGLRARVLAAAAAPPAPAGLSDRLWFSRAARLGWAAALVLLLALQVLAHRGVERRLDAYFGEPFEARSESPADVAAEIGIESEVRGAFR